MNQVVANFLGHVLEQIKYKKIHPYIRQELEDHIESLKEAYEKEGHTEQVAYEKAIVQMGDATSIGKELHEKHKPRCEWSVLILFTLLIGIGLFALARGIQYDVDGYTETYFVKQRLFIGMGSIIFFLLYFGDYKKLEKRSMLIYGLGIILIGCTIILKGYINGKSRFLHFLQLRSMFYSADLSIPFLVIGYIGFVRKWACPKLKNFMVLGVLGVLPCLMIVEISNKPTGIGIGAIFVSILTFYILGNEYKGDKIKTLIYLYSVLGLAGVVCTFYKMVVFSKDYLVKRFKLFFYPQDDPMIYGYYYRVLMNIRKEASLIGEGGYLKEQLTEVFEGMWLSDMIFTFVVGSMGWIMGGVLILVLLLAIIRLFRVANRVQDNYGRILSLTIACIFTLQFVLNISMNLGYTPIMTISLPFVSYGGSGLIINMGLLGLFMGIYRKKDLVLIMSQAVDKEGTLFSKLLG